MRREGRRAELVLAAVLVVAALALDLVWVRPERLTARRGEVRALAASLGASPEAAVAVPDEQDGTGITDEGPIRFLESAQQGGGLLQRELKLLEQQDRGPIRETSYYLEVYGEYRDVFAFLRELETGRGLVVVDRFRMVTASADPGVTLFLWATVFTRAG
jgi:hypothetical protein